MNLYIAFLRGINVGTHRVKMERLRELFGELGLSNVRTYIQSGNVFFETLETDRATLTKKIEDHLSKSLGYEVPVFLRNPAELEQTLQLDPFKAVEVTPDTRLIIVFTREELRPQTALPFISPKNDIEILKATPTEVFVVFRLMNGRMSDFTPFLKQVFGSKNIVTTRFHDTTHKILQAAKIP